MRIRTIKSIVASVLGSVLLVSMLAAPAQAGRASWVVTSFGWSGPSATVHLDPTTGAVTLAVTEHGRTVLEPSPVGIRTAQADLSQGLTFLRRTDRPVFEHYRSKVGKQLARTVLFHEATFLFQGNAGARLDLVVRVSNDGVAYRYVLPGNLGAVTGEASAFNVPVGSTAWLARYRRDYENPFLQTTAGGAAAAEFMHPALFNVDGTYLLITESSVDGSYSGGRLVHESGGTYHIKLWDAEVAVGGPLATPWRTMIVGDLATVTESTLVDDLAPPSRVRDTSWIQPGKVLWNWLAGGRAAQQSLTRQQEYVDFAAAHGWPYVLVDAGWYFDPNQWDVTDPNWQTNSWMPQLVQYAKPKGVNILVWIHFRDLDTAQERAQWLPTLEQWGVRGVKIDFMDSEAQERLAWYDQILPETAAHHLLVDFHGSTLPHGIQRTWPQVMTMEAVHGGEKSSLTTSHVTSLPFTRNVVGSMDYTPEAFQRASRPTSDAHEVALSVIFESGLQNFAGSPAAYAARPLAQWFLDQVPTVWDETRLLSGLPADHAVFARRSGDRWFIGGGFSGPARTASVPLRIGPGRWLVDLVRDGTGGLVREQHVMRGGETLTVDVAAEGGFAAIATRVQ
jgi:alpha-glucosidase